MDANTFRPVASWLLKSVYLFCVFKLFWMTQNISGVIGAPLQVPVDVKYDFLERRQEMLDSVYSAPFMRNQALSEVIKK